jgi:hypothetical protein
MYCDMTAESRNSLTRKVVHLKGTAGKHVSTATKRRYRGNGYTHNNRTAGKDCSQGLAHVLKDLFPTQKRALKSKY